MPRLRRQFRFLPPFLASLLALWLAGCGDSERMSYASELDEPNYREGQTLLKSGRRQEALTSFLKVIDKRRDDAPESHLEVGLLYAQHINDPLSAIYHFRKYLSIRPNSPQAVLVRQRIDAATREFARTIPAQPLESQGQRVDLIATLDRLKQENESLKQQLADVRAARGNVPTPLASGGETPGARPASPAPVDGNPLNFSLDAQPTVHTRPPTVSPPRPPPAVAPTSRAAGTTTPVSKTSPATTPARPGAGRTHVIRPGDTLSKLAQQYYGNRARWRDIYTANRGVMKNEGDLRVGMELKIP